jgi:hypothetical protein
VHIYTRSMPTSPGSAVALPGDAGVVFLFGGELSMEEGALRPPLFVLHHPTPMGGLKLREPHRWADARPPACSGTYRASGLVVLAARRGGVVGECIIDVVATENGLHVPATSLRR